MDSAHRLSADPMYGSARFGDAILAWLTAQGKNTDTLTVDDLAPVDHLHNGGRGATLTLAKMGGLRSGMSGAGLGGGIGGPARMLAVQYGCRVAVVDLTEEFCRVGEMLTAKTGLAERVTFRCASAVDTGLPAGAFDAVWMQNAAMNIQDRPALFREAARLLKPGGVFVFQEIAAGPVQPAVYPLNWASAAEYSFLYRPDDVRGWLAQAGFEERWFEDFTEDTKAERLRLLGAIQQQAAPPGYIPEAQRATIMVNLLRCLEEGRLLAIRGVYVKP